MKSTLKILPEYIFYNSISKFNSVSIVCAQSCFMRKKNRRNKARQKTLQAQFLLLIEILRFLQGK